MIKIQLATNGWIVSHKVEDEPEQIYVFDEGETDEETAESFKSVLYHIKMLCGPSESRYSAYRVMINIEPGDKSPKHPDNQEEPEDANDK